ncbi:fad binding domain-containing protein [Lasallia pustulata]|uniref:Fad binding domain-containing protein n=1 Tax=Lasallia pustulata TaxID=136370 RepID=A0A1W5DE66_9LECA|nr:fad binding domain-containing protein [Lasallia pustulata]
MPVQLSLVLKLYAPVQIVLANSSIVQVNKQSYPDLCWALRGGGNNFGIVTRFDLETFPQGQLWGGSKSYTIDQNITLLRALANFNEASPGDPDAALIVGFAYFRDNGTYIASVAYDYAKPEADPSIYDDFKAIPSRASSMRVTNLTDITLDFKGSEPAGYRRTHMTATFKNDAALLAEILEIYASETDPIKDIPDILPSCSFQPITIAQMSHFSKNGGNALGISSDGGPLICKSSIAYLKPVLNIILVFVVSTQWSAAEDDEVVYRIAHTILDRAVALAKSRGLAHRYIYQNYASSSQDVFGSYGAKNKVRLLRTQELYDPDRIFVDLQPGYFKLRPSTIGLHVQ